MDDQCSIGQLINEHCHKTSYGLVSKKLKLINEFDDVEQKLLKLRVSNDVISICEYHEKKFLLKYNHLFGKSCCDILKAHKKRITSDLREIKLEHLLLLKIPQYSDKLIPGQSLCRNCYEKLFVLETKSKVSSDTTDFLVDDYVPLEEIQQKVDSACSLLGLSPACKIRKLTSEKRHTAIEHKVHKVSEKLRKNLELCFDHSESTSVLEKQDILDSEYADLIKTLKEKCLIASKEEKVKIISLLPSSWSKEKIAREFQVSERLIRLTRNLVKEQGILPSLRKKKGISVSEETVEKVKMFYENDENSRMCSGKKECTKVIVNGEKIVKQKRLVLCNLNELYVAFKKAHPECQIGRSKFCELRPKWCILAGASGTHSVCVCIYHQNVKLMIDCAKLNVNYKELIDLLVCDINNYDCMMDLCENCPGKESVLELFRDSEEDLPDHIEYKQWVTTDRAEMVTVIKSQEEYFETLVEKLENLKTHHYISKIQGQFLKNKKENLAESECIVLADFAENFTFIIQDEIQGYHWVNEQATVHPFVLYFKNEYGKLNSHSICILSNYLEHSTAVVHAFQTKVINYIREHLPKVQKVFYFSDGSGSQYKNRYNFSNICYHKKDFDLEAEWHFFASCHGKNACDGVGGTTKREVTKASLQRTTSNQILNVEQMFTFCKEKITGITYFLVKEEDVIAHMETLRQRFGNTLTVKGTRKFHRFHATGEHIIRCYTTSQTTKFEDHCIAKIVPLTLEVNDMVACIYDGQWWLAQIEQISQEHNDVHAYFYHPAGPRTSFKKSAGDRVWIPVSNILRKLSALELTTATGRSYTISQQLSEEISMLLNGHLE